MDSSHISTLQSIIPSFSKVEAKLDKKTNRLTLTFTNAQNERLQFTAEIQNRRSFFDKIRGRTKKITITDSNNQLRSVYIKVNTASMGILRGKEIAKIAISHYERNNLKNLLFTNPTSTTKAAHSPSPPPLPQKPSEPPQKSPPSVRPRNDKLPPPPKDAPSAPPPPVAPRADKTPKPQEVPRRVEVKRKPYGGRNSAEKVQEGAQPNPEVVKAQIQRNINEKMELLKDVEISVYTSVEVNGEKHYINEPLDQDLKKELITIIEENRDKWLNEANFSQPNSWITKDVMLSNKKVIKIEIYPEGRELGRIDIRMGHIARGGSKKVFQLLNYDTGKIYAGAYGSDYALAKDVRADSYIKNGIENIRSEAQNIGSTEKVKKKLVTSKAVDRQEKYSKKSGITKENTKITQKLYEGGELFTILDKEVLPNGKTLTEHERVKLMISAFESLEQLHKMGIVHADIKGENMLLEIKVDPKTKEETYAVKVMDYGGGVDMNSPSVIKGTYGYIAPEHILSYVQGKYPVYNSTSDIYSMGVAFGGAADNWWGETEEAPGSRNYFFDIVYTPSFSAATFEENYNRIGNGRFSDEFQKGLNKMTAFDPKDRFQSITEAKEYFQKLL